MNYEMREIARLQRQINFFKMKQIMNEERDFPRKVHRRLIDDLDSIPEEFTDGWRGILLLRRNKEGESGNAQRKAIKRISRNVQEWKTYICELHDLQQTSHQGCRIYSSVNSRDMSKAIHEFKRRQLELDFGNFIELSKFYCDLKNRFFSCLMNPANRLQNHFLIDCDTQEEYAQAEQRLRYSGLQIMEYPTKNGMHIITRPFNPNDYGNLQIKKDDLMFIG